MSAPFQRLQEELAQWSPAVLSLARPVSAGDRAALEQTVGRALPTDYLRLLKCCDGADLRGDRLLAAREVRDLLGDFPRLLTPAYREDPDWNDRRPPAHLVPIAQDLDGNLKCLDLSTHGPEVVDWHRESGEFTTWHTNVVSWFLTCLTTLAIRFDRKGRPRPIRAGDSEALLLRELLAHLEQDPEGAFPRLELARWLELNSTPEEAMFQYRSAAEGTPEMALTHFHHARWAFVQGRHGEARSALRRCVTVPPDPNPRKHSFRGGYLAAAHFLLATAYAAAGQTRKGEEQKRLAERAAKRYGFEWYGETAEYQEMLGWAERGGP